MLLGETVTVIQSRSTNRPECRVTLEKAAPNMLVETGGTEQRVPYEAGARQLLWKAVGDAGNVSTLPATRCVHSVSFGTRLFVEVDGQRSPDLNCEAQTDPRVIALRDEARKVLQWAYRPRNQKQ